MTDIEGSGEDLIYTVKGGIGRVTFNRPQARNAMTFAMYDRLAKPSARKRAPTGPCARW